MKQFLTNVFAREQVTQYVTEELHQKWSPQADLIATNNWHDFFLAQLMNSRYRGKKNTGVVLQLF